MTEVQSNTLEATLMVGGFVLLLILLFGLTSDNKNLCKQKCGVHAVIACDIEYKDKDVVICESVSGQPIMKNLFP